MQIYLLLFTILFISPLFSKSMSLRWPIESKGEPYTKISSTFGESRLDHFHNGIDVPGEGFPVYSIQKGNLLWSRQGTHRPNEVPFGGGKTVIMQHETSWSGYMHLNEVNPDLYTLTNQEKIGISGKTGHSGGAHLHFFIYDFKLQRYYNPLLFYDKDTIQDNIAPDFKGYFIKNLAEVLTPVKILPDTNLQSFLFVFLQDRGIDKERWGIYQFKIYSGEEVKQENLILNYIFDYIYFDDIHWLNSSKLKFTDVYSTNQYNTRLTLDTVMKGNYFIEYSGITGPSSIQKLSLTSTKIASTPRKKIVISNRSSKKKR